MKFGNFRKRLLRKQAGNPPRKNTPSVTVGKERLNLALTDLMNGVEAREQAALLETKKLLGEKLAFGDKRNIIIQHLIMKGDHSINMRGNHGQVGQTLPNEGLLEASKSVKDFTGTIAATLGTLGKLVLGGD